MVQRPELPATGESAEAEAPVADETTEAPDPLHEALLELHGWYQEWAETARAEITRRDYLIRLGLAQRRTKTPKPPNDEPPA